jgi:hypothetical protein
MTMRGRSFSKIAGAALLAASIGSASLARAAPRPNDAEPSQCGVATYCGGPVISNIEIVPVFWTDSVRPSISAWAPGYLSTLAQSPFVDMLSEYSTLGTVGAVCGSTTDGGTYFVGPPYPRSTNQLITRGTARDPHTIFPMRTPGLVIQDRDAAIGEELLAQIDTGNLPAPTFDAQGYPNTVFVVFFPTAYEIRIGDFGSCHAFLGYHSSVANPAQVSCAGHYVPYVVVADCSGPMDDVVITVSHEIAESITNPDVGPTANDPQIGDGAWSLGPTSPCADTSLCTSCGEIADVCRLKGTAPVPGTTIRAQYVWSQDQKSCSVANPTVTAQTTPTFAPACFFAMGDAGASPHDAGPPPPPAPKAGPHLGPGWGPIAAGTRGSPAPSIDAGAIGENDDDARLSAKGGCALAPGAGDCELGAFAALVMTAAIAARSRARRRSRR